MTQIDQSRLLILFGYAIARLADMQFERAGFIILAGVAVMAVFHWWFDPWMQARS
jgi:hypothetical protein